MAVENQIQKANAAASGFITKFGESLKSYAQRSYDNQSFLKSAMIAIVTNDELIKCLNTDEGQLSIFNALRYAATTGLSLNPAEGKAALIAYGGKVQYQIMKNGMIDLAMDSGKVEFLTGDYVKEGDVFEIEKTINGDNYKFKPALKDRGEVIGFFAALKLKEGPAHVKWMTKQEVEEFRDKYSKLYNSKPEASPWNKSFDSMGIKTTMKALLRNVSVSKELDIAIGGEESTEIDFSSSIEKGTSAIDLIEKIEEPKEKIKPKEGKSLL